MNIVRKIGVFLKNLLLGILNRIKPRRNLRWLITTIIWIVILAYFVLGIISGFRVYYYHLTDKFTRFATRIFPFPTALVSARPVWVKDYYSQQSYIQRFTIKAKQQPPNEKELRDKIINRLIENKLLEIQAAKYGIRITDADVDSAYRKIVDEAGGDLEVQKVLNDLYQTTEKEFKKWVKQQVLREKVKNELILHIKASHILIKDEGRAKEIYERAKKGDDFGALAKEFSEDTKSRDDGGKINKGDWLTKGQIMVDNKPIPQFDETAFSAKIGEIVGPVKTDFGYEIIKVDDKKGKISESFNSWLENLKKNSTIWRFLK